MADSPHFQIPFRLERGAFAVVEEDSLEEIANCVYAIFATEYDWREEEPGFGITDQTFLQGGANLEELKSAARDWEPRAELLAETEWEELVERVRVTVNYTTEEEL